MRMAAQYEMLTQLAKAGTKLDFGQDLFVKFYQAFIASNRWQQYLKGVIPTLYVTAIALTIGVVLGSDGIPLCLNAVEVGKVMAGIYRNWDAGDYTAFCRKFDLPPDKKYKDYSAGMQRKLCIAVALSHHAKLLLLDEPTSSLDIHNQYQVLQIVQELCHHDGLTAIVVIHDLNLALRFCDRFLLLRQGQVYANGNYTVLSPKALQDVYQIDGHVVEVENQKMVLVRQ